MKHMKTTMKLICWARWHLHNRQCSPLAPPVPRRARDTVMGGRSGALMALPRFLFSAEVLGWEAREDETNSSPGLPS